VPTVHVLIEEQGVQVVLDKQDDEEHVSDELQTWGGGGAVQAPLAVLQYVYEPLVGQGLVELQVMQPVLP
jgi:hypothetical protein